MSLFIYGAYMPHKMQKTAATLELQRFSWAM